MGGGVVATEAEQSHGQGGVVVDPFAAAMSESDLLENIRHLCRALRLPYFHAYNSKNSPEGWPDVACCRGDTLYLYELKTMKGKCTPAQLQWLDALSRVRRVSVGIWRPDSWRSGEIEGALRGRVQS